MANMLKNLLKTREILRPMAFQDKDISEELFNKTFNDAMA